MLASKIVVVNQMIVNQDAYGDFEVDQILTDSCGQM